MILHPTNAGQEDNAPTNGLAKLKPTKWPSITTTTTITAQEEAEEKVVVAAEEEEAEKNPSK